MAGAGALGTPGGPLRASGAAAGWQSNPLHRQSLAGLHRPPSRLQQLADGEQSSEGWGSVHDAHAAAAVGAHELAAVPLVEESDPRLPHCGVVDAAATPGAARVVRVRRLVPMSVTSGPSSAGASERWAAAPAPDGRAAFAPARATGGGSARRQRHATGQPLHEFAAVAPIAYSGP
jgi:hypothetical protein